MSMSRSRTSQVVNDTSPRVYLTTRFRYGSKLIIAGEVNGGSVVNVLYAAILGGVALGQAAPNVQYFVAGKAAAARVWMVLNRQPLIADDQGW